MERTDKGTESNKMDEVFTFGPSFFFLQSWSWLFLIVQEVRRDWLQLRPRQSPAWSRTSVQNWALRPAPKFEIPLSKFRSHRNLCAERSITTNSGEDNTSPDRGCGQKIQPVTSQISTSWSASFNSLRWGHRKSRPCLRPNYTACHIHRINITVRIANHLLLDCTVVAEPFRSGVHLHSSTI